MSKLRFAHEFWTMAYQRFKSGNWRFCLVNNPTAEAEGYALTKQLFWDLIRIRYGWQLLRISLLSSIRHHISSNMIKFGYVM